MFPSGPQLQAKNAQEYMALIDQAIAEMEDLRDVVTFSADYSGELEDYVGQLGKHLDDLKRSLTPDNPRLTGEDLPMMPIVNSANLALLPFKNLLLRINATNRYGYHSG